VTKSNVLQPGFVLVEAEEAYFIPITVERRNWMGIPLQLIVAE